MTGSWLAVGPCCLALIFFADGGAYRRTCGGEGMTWQPDYEARRCAVQQGAWSLRVGSQDDEVLLVLVWMAPRQTVETWRVAYHGTWLVLLAPLSAEPVAPVEYRRVSE